MPDEGEAGQLRSNLLTPEETERNRAYNEFGIMNDDRQIVRLLREVDEQDQVYYDMFFKPCNICKLHILYRKSLDYMFD
jgi:hypothetical protein